MKQPQHSTRSGKRIFIGKWMPAGKEFEAVRHARGGKGRNKNARDLALWSKRKPRQHGIEQSCSGLSDGDDPDLAEARHIEDAFTENKRIGFAWSSYAFYLFRHGSFDAAIRQRLSKDRAREIAESRVCQNLHLCTDSVRTLKRAEKRATSIHRFL